MGEQAGLMARVQRLEQEARQAQTQHWETADALKRAEEELGEARARLEGRDQDAAARAARAREEAEERERLAGALREAQEALGRQEERGGGGGGVAARLGAAAGARARQGGRGA